MSKAKPEKKYDLSRYLAGALLNRPDAPLVSTGGETDTDNYMVAQSVLLIDPNQFEDVAERDYIKHAHDVCNDVVRLVSATDSDMLVSAPATDPADADNQLTCAQGLYLIGLMHGLSPFRILDILKLSKMCPALWGKMGSTAYKEALEAVKMTMAEQLESIVLQNAMNNPSAAIERMFAIKAWMPKYRDNAPLPSAPAVTIRISIDGEEISQDYGKRILEIEPTG